MLILQGQRAGAVCDRLGIDVWEVIERSRHQALRLHEVHAGAGMGGHCIPVDRSTFPGR